MNHDQIRREARANQAAHDSAMPQLQRAYDRFFDRGDRTADETSGALLSGLNRRSLFRFGGITIAGAAILAACGSDQDDSKSTSPSTTAGSTSPSTPGSSTPMGAADDVLLLRTVSSLEVLAVAVYQTAIDSGLVKTAAVGDAAKLFQSQHQEHAAFFQGLTTKAGGKAFTDPNPVVFDSIKPTIAALKDEQGVLQLALSLEIAAAQSYQAGVGNVTDMTLNKALMSVGGVEARHAAVIASVLAQDPVPMSFGAITNAVKPGTGVT